MATIAPSKDFGSSDYNSLYYDRALIIQSLLSRYEAFKGTRQEKIIFLQSLINELETAIAYYKTDAESNYATFKEQYKSAGLVSGVGGVALAASTAITGPIGIAVGLVGLVGSLFGGQSAAAAEKKAKELIAKRTTDIAAVTEIEDNLKNELSYLQAIEFVADPQFLILAGLTATYIYKQNKKRNA